jgi:hypothetical protein
VFRSILSRLLIAAAVMVATPIGATVAPGGSGTAQIDGADQVALGAAKPADGRVVPAAGRKPDLGARLSVVLGLLPGEAAALTAPTWSPLESSRPAPTAPGRSVPSCKTSRGPPPYAFLAS